MCWLKRLITIMLFSSFLIVGCQTTSSQQPPNTQESFLFAHKANHGAITKLQDDRYQLVLHNLHEGPLAFTDRPYHKVYKNIPLQNFVALVNESKHKGGLPNAYLSASLSSDGNHYKAGVVEILHVTYNKTDTTLTFILVLLDGELPVGRINNASLVIDNFGVNDGFKHLPGFP